MSMGIVLNEMGHFRPFSHICSFFSRKWFTVKELLKIEWDKSFFPLYLTIIVVDQDPSFKKSESHFFMSNKCCLIVGLSENCWATALTNSVCRAFSSSYTDSIDILNSYKVSFFRKSVYTISRVEKVILDILGTLFYN